MITYLNITIFLIVTTVIFFNMKKQTQESDKTLLIVGAVVLGLIVTIPTSWLISNGTTLYYTITNKTVVSRVSTRLLPIDDEDHFLLITDQDHDEQNEYTFSHLQLDGSKKQRVKVNIDATRQLVIMEDDRRPPEIERVIERLPANRWTRFVGKDRATIKERELRILVPERSILYSNKGDLHGSRTSTVESRTNSND